MTANGLQVVTLDFPDPEFSSLYQGDFHQVNSSLSFTFSEQPNRIRTLSTNGAQSGSDIDGLLYTPYLPAGICNASNAWVPRNATNPSNLPTKKSISLIAVAPWLSPNCTLAYFDAVKNDDVKAFLFYLPDNSSAQPPLANNKIWTLGDGGRWKSNNAFPVYAVPSTTGQTLMEQLANYSGNVTEVPNGHELASIYHANDYIRLAAEIDVAGGSKLPSLWVFLLIVLGIVFVIIVSTSFCMHWIQRSRRNRLRRRVANGSIDLEALGIRRLKVPQEVLDQMPIYPYNGPPAKESELSPLSNEEHKGLERSLSSPPPFLPNRTQFSQPTCAICLDDYTSGETNVRELPCRHIFHPECIDSFLRESSSLCPMCKKTVLPKGYCPAVITNAMVRRERLISRIRDRITVEEDPSNPSQQSQVPGVPRVRDAVRSAVTGGRRVFSAPVRSPRTPASVPVEMHEGFATTERCGPPIQNPTSIVEQSEPPEVRNIIPYTTPPEPLPPGDNPQALHRREWARQRAVLMLGNREIAVDSQIEAEASRRPRWRKVVGRIWPGMA